MTERSTGTGLSPLSAAELAQVAAELTDELAGHGLGKIYDAPHGLVLEVGRGALLLSAHPRASRAHAVDRGGSAPRSAKPHEPPPRTPAAVAPSAFAMLCRKRLTGLRVEALRVLPGERVLIVDVGAARDRLIAELTGPHGNIFLVEPDGRIAGLLRRSGSTTRTLGAGATWTPPDAVDGADAGATRWRDALRFGDSPGVAARVRAHYDQALATSERAELVNRAGVAIRRDVERLRRRAIALRGDLAKAEAAQVFRKLGDLLLAHLRELPPRGATSVTVSDDFEDGSPLTIILDPTLDGRANATRYYRQHKRLAAGLAKIRARADETARSLAAREELAHRLPTMSDAELGPLAARAPAPAQRPRGPDPDEPRLPYRVFRASTGDVVWVGRSAADNDTLTFRHARGADLWLHTRDAPGAHVVVPLRGGTQMTDQLLLDAATLAAHHSPLGGEAQVDIAYTSVKNVRKGKGMAPGAVFTSDTKTIRVRLEEARLKRLLTPADAI